MVDRDLCSLAYFSQSALSSDAAVRLREIEAILTSARTNNRRAGITGALLVSGSAFAQVLEGPRAAVAATFARIQRDPRHRNVRQLIEEPIAARRFARWSMAYAGLAEAGPSGFDLNGIHASADRIMAEAAGTELIRTLRAMIGRQEAEHSR